ncbi:hypothetical protein CfE428DRAFT_5226 [Chthoniobacter flavus Ellin428]|uniref:Uncharacterized protein n=1 Tax=Chthoniobacter flavus Ellin428 TaxID=497964 RepID=B4D8I6_9BACT|nr:hypothetical protein CfE428DRAFT_5226 [Chthoniobacter flavus Ellin428]TCO86967.1 hypothetical protein EV701_12562 [Chthoniobacter flavus]
MDAHAAPAGLAQSAARSQVRLTHNGVVPRSSFNEGGKSVVLEIVAVDLFDVIGVLFGYADAVFDHQFGEAPAVD